VFAPVLAPLLLLAFLPLLASLLLLAYMVAKVSTVAVALLSCSQCCGQGCESRRQTFSSISRPGFREI
jgi:hypothetical protein